MRSSRGAFWFVAGVYLLAGPASAAPLQFFGEDLNNTQDPTTPADDPQRIATPNADAARAQFLSRLTAGVDTESFESFSEGQVPTTLTFGTDTATVSGVTTVKDIPSGTFDGTFPGTGDKFLLQFGGAGTFRINFSTPQAAIGFFSTDVEAVQLQLIFDHPLGGPTFTTVPSTIPAGSGSAFFFGLIDRDNPFTGVTFSNANAALDGFGFDDFTIARPEQVPEPAGLAVLAAAGGLAALRRVRRRPC